MTLAHAKHPSVSSNGKFQVGLLATLSRNPEKENIFTPHTATEKGFPRDPTRESYTCGILSKLKARSKPAMPIFFLSDPK